MQRRDDSIPGAVNLRRSGVLAILVGALALTSGCDDDDDGDDGDDGKPMSTTDPSGDEPEPECTNNGDCADGEMCSSGSCVDMFWAVGGDGSVLRVAADGTVEPHPALGTGLRAIECNGATDAWVVGTAGFVAHTTDGGASWAEVTSGVGSELRDVEADHGATVTAVGVDGAWIVADGAGFRSIIGARGDLEGVGLGAAGMLAIGSDGTVWAAEPSAALAVAVAEVTLLPTAIDLAHDVPRGVIVGRAGTLLWSEDGVSWTARASGTRLDLHAVQIARDGHAAIAVGDAGVVVYVDATSTNLVRVEPAETTDLRDIHLDARGHGAAVGKSGVVALTRDAGRTFEVFQASASDLVGVDALGPWHW